MSITYYAHTERELPCAGVQPDDLVIYIGTIRDRDKLLDGPTSSDCSSKAYAYRWTGDEAEDIDVDFTVDSTESCILDITAGVEHYAFLSNEVRSFLRQVSGPEKPVMVANIGADAIRVDTFLGKYSIPAGMILRLDENAPRRENKTVLLTFADQRPMGSPLKSAMLLDGARWRPLNICVSGGSPVKSIQVKDSAFAVQTLAYNIHGSVIKLKDPPNDPDYEIYFRCPTDWGLKVQFAGLGMKEEGLIRKHIHFSPEPGAIYDFQKLRQAPTVALMEQCTAQLPGLEYAADLPGGDVPWPEVRNVTAKSGIPNFWPPDWPDLTSAT